MIQRKLEVIARDEDDIVSGQVNSVWENVDPGPHCPWIGEAMERVNRACARAIDSRGTRMALSLSKTLPKFKLRYTKQLAAELKALIDPFFPEDLYVAAAVNAHGVYQRRGNPQKFDERAYEQALVLARVGSANMARDAKQKAYLAIDEYILLARSEQGGGSWDWLELKPNFYGLGVNLKKLFSRNKTPSE